MHEFWEFTAFVANVIIFIVVGVVIALKVQPQPIDYLVLALVYLTIHLVRMVNILALYPIMRKTGYGLPKKDAVVVWWGASIRKLPQPSGRENKTSVSPAT